MPPNRTFRIVLLIFLIAFAIQKAVAQPSPPSLRCISVESNGNVTLNWVAPSDTGSDFGGYHVFVSNTSSGPFNAVDSIFNYNTLTTTITSVNATNSIFYFFIKTREGCCANYSVASDTLRTMRMIVTPLSNERVRLNWNRIHTPPLPSTSSNFAVSKDVSGTFSVFRNTPDTTALDSNFFCNKFINYRVTQADISGCVSVSSVDGELFRDTRGPAQTLIDTVSIDPITGNVMITWLTDSSADTQGYVIYQFNGISYDSIGAVSGINSLSFTNTNTNSATLVETYTVAAFDSCKNLGPLAVNHSTMLLTGEVIKCDALLKLEWTPYENMNGGVNRYEVWIRESTGPWTLEALRPSTVLNYEKPLLVPGATYDIYIVSVGGEGQTATSNMITLTADILQQPAFVYIRSASVEGNTVKVTCQADPSGDIESFMLYASTSPTGIFSQVASLPYNSTGEYVFTDYSSNPGNGRVFYQVTAVDSCGKEFVKSNVAGTVFLSVESSGEFISDLSWTTYTGWQYPPGSFRVYRVESGVVQSVPIVSFSGDTLFFTEDVSEITSDNGNMCYVILASEDSLNTFGFSDSAFSNIDCAPLTPYAFIPNAFTPGGKNPVFKPVLVFGDASGYSLQIFNRWGQMVFSSDSPAAGWDGTFEGGEAMSGLYAYRLVYKGLNRKEYRKTGTLVLLR